MYKCRFFSIQELVSKQVYNRYGEFAWRFFDDAFKQDIDMIRNFHGQGLTINNWLFGGNNEQCGLRSNLDPMVKNKTTLYCSPHCMGKAVDLHSKDNAKLWKDCKWLIETGKLRTIKRIESQESTKNLWVHVDSFGTNEEIEIFKD